MADKVNEYLESFPEGLKEISENIKAAIGNENTTSDGSEHPNPETQGHEEQPSNSLDIDRNISESSFSREQRITSPVPPVIIRINAKSLDSSSLDYHVRDQLSGPEAKEKGHVTPFLSPVETSEGKFFEADDNEWNLSKLFSSHENSRWCNLRPVPQMKPKNTNLETDAYNIETKGKSSELILGKKENNLEARSLSPTCIEREKIGSEELETMNRRKITPKTKTQIGDFLSSEVASNSAALGHVAGVEVFSVTGNSGNQRESHQNGKKERFECFVCEKDFVKIEHLLIHQREHLEEKSFECHTCFKTFARQSHLKSHEVIHTGKKLFACRICSNAFSQKHCLEVHLRTHSGDKNHSCLICCREFSHKPNLTAHLRAHSGEKPHICHICSKGFSHKPNLVTHLRIHTREKPHSCHICSKGFYHQSNLVTHLRIHRGEKPHICHICSKGFSHKPNLATHLRIHTGEKPHICHICSKEFSHRGNLVSHLRTHSREKIFKCKFCSRDFVHQSKCIRHQNRKHGEMLFTSSQIK